MPRLIDELARHSALQTKSTFLRQLAKADLLIVDDFGLGTRPKICGYACHDPFGTLA